jgi:hypothetical protein
MDAQRRMNREAQAKRWAMGLGWFSIGLGLAELFLARPMARMLGMRGQEGLLRFYGLREVATGVGIFACADKPAPWIWGRVAGDALDLATLAANVSGNPRKAAVFLAIANVGGVAALDFMTADRLSRLERTGRAPVRDYSDRVGLGGSPESLRGAARKDFEVPRDMQLPPGMRPTMH